MQQAPYNLDENISEYFEFIVGGHTYKFRQLTTEEVDEMQKIAALKDENKFREFLYKFVEKTNDADPDFSATAKKMLIKQWSRFQKMIISEMTGDAEGNPGSESTPGV